MLRLTAVATFTADVVSAETRHSKPPNNQLNTGKRLKSSKKNENVKVHNKQMNSSSNTEAQDALWIHRIGQGGF